MIHEDEPIFVLAAAFVTLDILIGTVHIHEVPFDQRLGGALISAKAALKFIHLKLSVTVFEICACICNNS